MRPHWAFCVLLLLISVSASSEAACEFSNLLRSMTYIEARPQYARSLRFDVNDPRLKGLRSEWGRSPATVQTDGEFWKLDLLHRPDPVMKVYQKSIAEQRPDIKGILEDMERFQATTDRFKSLFRSANAREPNVNDYRNFFRSRAQLFESGAREFAKQLALVDSKLANNIRMNIEHEVIKHRKYCQTINSAKTIEQIEREANEMTTIMNGYVTELHAAVSMPNVQSVGLTLGKMPIVKSRIAIKIDDLAEELKYEPELWNDWKKEFKRMAKKGEQYNTHGDTAYRQLKFIKGWIESKEIDVVRSAEGKLSWLEIKRNKSPLTLEDFSPKKFEKSPQGQNKFRKERAIENSTKKSMFDQIMEDKEILRFLGLDQQIRLEYYATGGMTREVRELLEKHGVSVISP